MNEAEPSPDPRPTLRLGSYLLLQQLGSGGMSSVFRAVHEETGNIVAVKVLPGDLAKNLTLLQRFMREAKSAEALDHPTIVMIYDRGFDRGRHYLVLEYVEGGDLQDRVRAAGPLSIEDATKVIRQTAEGLKYAAAQGMIHRDIKPANLLLTPDGTTKIIDLGLALQLSDEDERVTRDGTTVGTVDYMAPEQARDSRKTSVRSDIYSLGCTFHYLLTGKPPYPGGNLADKLTRHVTAPVADPCVLRPDLPESLGRLARRMMAKKPEDRFADHDHLLRCLDQAVAEAAQPIVLDALVVDDDDADFRSDRAEVAESSGRGYTLAELVELDDEPIRPRAGRVDLAPAIPMVSIAELAELDGQDHPAMAGARVSPPMRPSIAAIFEEDEPTTARAPLTRHRSDELPLKTWIMAGVMVGLAIAAIGVAASFLISLAAEYRSSGVAGQAAPAGGPADGFHSESGIADGPEIPVQSPQSAGPRGQGSLDRADTRPGLPPIRLSG